MQIFAQTSRHMSTQKFPILSVAVPIYDFLMDKIEIFQAQDEISPDMKAALDIGLNKLKVYYACTDDSLTYPIITSKYYYAILANVSHTQVNPSSSQQRYLLD